MVLRGEIMSGEYFSHMLDLLISLKNGCISGVRVRVGRLHQLLNSGCMEHVDFATDSDGNYDDFEEFGDTDSQVISRVSIRDIHEDDTQSTERDYNCKPDEELFDVVRKHNIDALRRVAFAIVILSQRYGMGCIVDDETLEVRLERVYRQACARRRWWVVRYCAARLRKVTNSLAPGITNMLVRGKQITVGVSGCREMTITAPTTPDEIAVALFDSYPENEPQASVLQQELIIACSDLVRFVSCLEIIVTFW
ncbi:unnamed protein product [Brugia timori]|uniref:Phosphorylase b kinase regulatory subunit n=1 Tax=Brugia timori TaxID=42155 RepID=A0A0R3Q9K7_9BILA|nr:unnamed protein product [Brugia timori]